MKKVLLALVIILTAAGSSWAYDFSAVAPSGQTLYYNITSIHSPFTVAVVRNSSNPPTGNLVIPSTVTRNGITYSVTCLQNNGSHGAFDGCEYLTSVTIPSSVTSIGADGFLDCDGLTRVNYTGTIGQWCAITFGNAEANPLYYAHHLYINNVAVTALSIPSTMNTIGNYIFAGCSDLASLTIHEGVTSIGRQAFSGCSALTSVTIPSSVVTVSSNAFSGCTSLATLYFNPTCCTFMGVPEYTVFEGCDSLATIIVGNNVTRIPQFSFFDCTSLTSLTLGSGLDSIGEGAFYGCTMLASLTIPGAVTAIGERAFRNCYSISTVNFNAANCSYMGSSSYPVFYNCNSLTTLNIGSGVTRIPDCAFYNCNGIGSVTLPGSVTSIGHEAFYHCSSLSGITIPSAVTTIGNHAFNGCIGFSSLVIPDLVTTIGASAFRNCTGLTEITIGKSVATIGNSAFSNLPNLATVHFNAIHCTSMGSSVFPVFGDNPAVTALTIGDSVTRIPDYAFSSFRNITRITIPQAVTAIETHAFDSCANIRTIRFNATSCTDMGTSASPFASSTSIDTLVFGSNVTRIPDCAFNGCGSFSSITLPNALATIGQYAFASCSGISSLVIPDSVTSIAAHAFANCSALDTLVLGSAVETIGQQAFANCSTLADITSLAFAAPLLGSQAFEGVSDTTPVHIPCGSATAYGIRWAGFSNFLEAAAPAITVTSANDSMGSAYVVLPPSCVATGAVVNATPNTGFVFDRWSDNDSTNPRMVNVTADMALTAYFANAPAPDTVIVRDTTYIDRWQHDTTYITLHDTTLVTQHDTAYIDRWQHDTTYITLHDTTLVTQHDTAYIDRWQHDTTYITLHDTTLVTQHDTAYIDRWQHDTTYITLHDTAYITVHDTAYITLHDTVTMPITYYDLMVRSSDIEQGIAVGSGRFPDSCWVEIAAVPLEGYRFVGWDDGSIENPRSVQLTQSLTLTAAFASGSLAVGRVEDSHYTITTGLGVVTIEGAENQTIRIIDNVGRIVASELNRYAIKTFALPAGGTYLIQIGSSPAKKVVVIR